VIRNPSYNNTLDNPAITFYNHCNSCCMLVYDIYSALWLLLRNSCFISHITPLQFVYTLLLSPFAYYLVAVRNCLALPRQYIVLVSSNKSLEIYWKSRVGRVKAPRVISISDAHKVSIDIAIKSWQRKWNEESKGRYTYELIPVVDTKVLWPRTRDIAIAYGRMLLHDTMLNDDSYRLGTAETNICDCGQDNETVLFSSTLRQIYRRHTMSSWYNRRYIFFHDLCTYCIC